MKSFIKSLAVAMALAMSGVTLSAADVTTPEIKKFSFDDNAILMALSDNGQWAVAGFGTGELAEMGKAKLVNAVDGSYVNLQTDDEIATIGKQDFSDVTNDGEIIVGAYKGKPAYWKKSTRTWVELPMPDGASGGLVTAVTPDGKYAIGSGSSRVNEYYIIPAMWDLTTDKLVELPNLPVYDMTHEDQKQQQLISISNDGRYILGSLSYSYVYPVAPCVFLYDRNSSTAKFIGFDASDYDDWKPWDSRLLFVDEGKISPNGKHVVCHVRYFAAGESDNDGVAVYDVETGKFEILPGSEGMFGSAVDDLGTIYAASPMGSPIRDWSVYKDGYWYPISQILKQNYDIDVYAKVDNSGTVSDVTSDGKTLISMVDPTGESYVLRLPQSAGTLCSGIRLLDEYSISPVNGMTFSKLRSLEITFTRDVEIVGGATSASLCKADGTLVRNSSGLAVSSASNKTVVVTFRPTDLEDGQTYTVTIPAGTIAIKGDKNKTNGDIKVNYIGRADVPVAVTGVYPKNGAVLSKIDNASNPVSITFDTQVVKTENASCELYLVDGDSEERVCTLNSYVEGNVMIVYPSAAQFLYLDKNYKVVIAAGSVTDYSGNGANGKIEINYVGSYVREISHDSAILFADDFNNMSQSLINFMRYEGDHLTPSTAMAEWGFDADNQPWNFSIRDNKESSDFCAASHSSYSGLGGQSDDWMVIPQLEIPDQYVSLTFNAQSYLASKKDYLKVLVWECEENITALSKDVMARMKSEAVVVFNEQLTAGATENLTDEWTSYRVDLAKYAGKKIYIAFLNDNKYQSAVFVDNVAVSREMKFFLSLTTAESVVNRSDVTIAGTLTANAVGETFNNLTMILKDASGNEVDRLTASNLALKKGDRYNFTFAKPLPLVSGKNNRYSIEATLDYFNDEVNLSIKNLAFEPTKRVVLEELTGITCVNCPLGHIAIEALHEMYGEKFIPVGIHTYTGDPLHSGLQSYSDFLGLSAAPSAIIQRSGVVSMPIIQDYLTGDYTMSNGYTLWKDHVAAAMDVPADAEISAKYELDKSTGDIRIPVTIKYALDAANLNLNVFVVMVEDGIKSYQENTFASNKDPLLGDWGQGGKYGFSMVYDYIHNDVARACWGTSYNGTAGLMPQSMTAGEEYTTELRGFSVPETVDNVDMTKLVVMLIDGNTDALINAVCVKAPGYVGVEDVTVDDLSCKVSIVNGNVVVAGNGEIAATVYDAAGRVVSSAAASDLVTLTAEGYHGFAIVQAVINGKMVVKKLAL